MRKGLFGFRANIFFVFFLLCVCLCVCVHACMYVRVCVGGVLVQCRSVCVRACARTYVRACGWVGVVRSPPPTPKGSLPPSPRRKKEKKKKKKKKNKTKTQGACVWRGSPATQKPWEENKQLLFNLTQCTQIF